MGLVNPHTTKPVLRAPIKVSAAYGRLYVSGPGFPVATRVRGAALNVRRSCVELSLTLEALRELRRVTGVTREQFAQFCTPDVVRWARAAYSSEQVVKELHTRLAGGWRPELPWEDARADTVAPEGTDSREAYTDDRGVRRWKYRTPFDHQQVMAAVGCTLDGAAFLCEMGTGKTRSALESMRHQVAQGNVDVVLVWCPKSVIGTWVNQLLEFTPPPALVPLRLEGTITQRRAQIAALAGAPRGTVAIGNYDILHHVREAVTGLAARVRLAIVCDEMHKIKNPHAKVTQAAMECAQQMPWRLGMTGTPVGNGIQDIWSQWYVVDLGITFGANFVQYRREFLKETPMSFRVEPQDGALDEVGLRMRRRGVRYRKAECLDLPPKVYEVEEIEMAAEQERHYHEMEDQLMTWLEENREAIAQNKLVAILRLTQITSGFVGDTDQQIARFRENPKLDRLTELVEENIDTQQIIVWCMYREDVRAICERLARFRPAVIQGPPRPMEPETAERMFQRGETRLLVAHPASGGLGLNLQAASLAIYYSQGYSLITRSQSEDRCHRAGSERHHHVTYVDLVMRCRDRSATVDTVVRAALASKKRVSDVVVDLQALLVGSRAAA